MLNVFEEISGAHFYWFSARFRYLLCDFVVSKLIGMEANSEVILNQMIKADSSKWIYSQVIEERVVDSDYQAIVHVSDRGSDVRLFICFY